MAAPSQQFPMSTQSSISGPMSSMGIGVTSSQPVYTQPQPSQGQGLQHQQSFPGPVPSSAPSTNAVCILCPNQKS